MISWNSFHAHTTPIIAACLLPGWVAAADISRLAAGLESEQFAERELAERELLELGLAVVDESLNSAVLPENATDADADQHFTKLGGVVRALLQEKLYVHLDRLQGLESQFRASRVRALIEQHFEHRLGGAQVGFAKRLPPAEAEKVHGYSGGFREGTTWFDTQFGNRSTFTVTSIRILVRLTDKQTGKKIERQATLGSDGAPLLPGQTVNWSVDLGIKRTSDDEFFWETVAIYGTAPVVEDVSGAIPVPPAIPRIKK
ncbi:MAG TPA: hypothetical protein VFV87_11550 [Pirellulaceae bacterium]|nr:hypothetical protein [Pirellulaceae bacterium]